MQLHEQKLLNELADLCHLITCEVLNVKGKYFYSSQVETDPKPGASSSVCRDKGGNVFSAAV